MEQVVKLVRKRGTLRGMLTRLIQKIDAELGSPTVTISKVTLSSYILQLEEKEAKLKELSNLIEDEISDPDQYDADLLESEKYLEEIMNCKALCKITLQDLTNGGPGTLLGSPAHQPIATTPVQIATPQLPTVKLPQIHIEKFSGDINKWQEFWTQYQVTIHNNCNLADEEKFSYLRSYLSGTARASISGLELTGINYGIAIDTLKERFGEEDKLVQAHMKRLRNIEPVRRSSDIRGLRRFFDTLYINLKSLESLKENTETYAVFLIPTITESLPEDIVLSYTLRSRKQTGPKLKALIDFLQDEVESREQACKLKNISWNTSDQDYKPRMESTHRREGSNFKSRSTNPSSTMSFNAIAKSKKENNCIFCQSTHNIEECTALTSAERKDIIKSQSRCFVCLGLDHFARFCRAKRVSCKYCNKRHHQAICEQQFPDQEVKLSNEKSQDSTILMGTVSQGKKTSNRQEIYLQTGWARISNGNKNLVVRYFLDNGSHRTYLLERISNKLGLTEVGKESLSMHSFENEGHEVERRRVKFTIGNIDNSQMVTIEALESPKISSARLRFPNEYIITVAEEKGIRLADCYDVRRETEHEIGILVGADFYWKVATCNLERVQDSLMVMETIFGWCLLGATSGRRNVNNDDGVYNVCVLSAVSEENEDDRISEGLRAFWDLDSLGIVDQPSDNATSERLIRQEFESKIKYDGQRYQVSLPWKNDVILTNNNRTIAERRFEHQLKKLRKDRGLLRDYSEVIKGYLEAGIAEPAYGEGLPGRTFYLPHREVVKRDRTTTKTRVVFDASSHAICSPSLNDCLHAGSALNVDLLGLLFKFRKHKVAFTGDIEKAFLQISLATEDRDVTRFFWITDKKDPEKIVLRMTRVLFGINSSPYLLAATIRYHLQKYKEKYPEGTELLTDSLYVDDLLGGACDEKAP